MLVGIIIGFIAAGIFLAFLEIIEDPYIKIIEGKGEVGESPITARKKLKKIRYMAYSVYILFLIALIVIVPVLLGDDKNQTLQHVQGLFCGALFGTYRLLVNNKKYSHYGKISTGTIEDVRNCKNDYILYLRAFENDDYTYKSKRGQFSEDKFVSCFPSYVKVFSIGMTKEVYCPLGSTRIYCDDDTWRKNVKEMIDGAKAVVVLVSDRDSCIWEINNLRFCSDKAFYIINDIDKYNNVKNQTMLPDLPIDKLGTKKAFMVYKGGYHYTFKEFSYSKMQYKDLIRSILNKCNIEKPIVNHSDKNVIAVIGFICSFLIPIIGYILSIIGMKKAASNEGKGRNLAFAGMVISIVNFVIQAVIFLLSYLC